MTYALTRAVLGNSLFIDISKEEYLFLLKAKKSLIELLYIEEKFDIIIENYLEFEMELLSSSTRLMVHSNQDYFWFQEEGNKINRRVINLLSACRLYIDHGMHHLSNIYGDKSEQFKSIKSFKSEEYDTKLGYRVMEAMRNYVQHRGFPIHKWTYNSKRIESNDTVQHLFSITPFIKPDELELDRKFKTAILDELKKIGNELDIKPLLREYVSAIANVHKKLREIIDADIIEWENRLFSMINVFKERIEPEECLIGMAAVRMLGNNTYTDIEPISTDFIKRRKALEQKNKHFEYLERRYVTSEIIYENA